AVLITACTITGLPSTMNTSWAPSSGFMSDPATTLEAFSTTHPAHFGHCPFGLFRSTAHFGSERVQSPSSRMTFDERSANSGFSDVAMLQALAAKSGAS